MSVNKLKSCGFETCTGCGACINVCRLDAIKLVSDREGFFYPQVGDNCIECGACEFACPAFGAANILTWNKASRGFLAIGTDARNIRLSASGGAFATFAKYMIEEQNGVVFGACMDEDFFVRHKSAENLDELAPMLGSKYVQSNVGYTYRECKQFLELGRKVLFSGTPCQIAGLYGFLGKKRYKNLVTVDIVCHGVSAPGAFRQYIDWISKQTGKTVADYRFRNRTKYDRAGYISRTVLRSGAGKDKAVFCSAKKDVYYKAYLDGLLFRKSCFSCPYAQGYRVGDLTIGDCNTSYKYKSFHPCEGVSIVLENSDAGKSFWSAAADRFDYIPLDVAAEMQANGNLHRPSVLTEDRDKVCGDFAAGQFEVYKEKLLKHMTLFGKLRVWAQTHIPLKLRMKISGGVKWVIRKLKHGK